MRALAVWLPVFAVVFGGYAVASHLSLSDDPRRVFVIVDSSFPMEEHWSQVSGELDELGGARYTEYALATEKNPVHSWQDRLMLGAVDPFAPCDFSELTGYAEVDEADEVVLITGEGSCPTDALPGDWQIITQGS